MRNSVPDFRFQDAFDQHSCLDGNSRRCATENYLLTIKRKPVQWKQFGWPGFSAAPRPPRFYYYPPLSYCFSYPIIRSDRRTPPAITSTSRLGQPAFAYHPSITGPYRHPLRSTRDPQSPGADQPAGRSNENTSPAKRYQTKVILTCCNQSTGV